MLNRAGLIAHEIYFSLDGFRLGVDGALVVVVKLSKMCRPAGARVCVPTFFPRVPLRSTVG
jgi:hypothetical protein